jgi:hypothetical protein
VKILENLWRVGSDDLTAPEDAAIYLTRFDDEAALVDAGCGPGHSPGSLIYTAELDSKKIIFGQDVHGPLHPTLLSNRQDYTNCLKFILSLEADILCEGHFGIFQGKKEIDQFVRSFL